jgi:hypothetical protein
MPRLVDVLGLALVGCLLALPVPALAQDALPPPPLPVDQPPAAPSSPTSPAAGGTAAQPAQPPDISPVVRAQAGNMGFFFNFAGLATLTTSGPKESTVVQGAAATPPVPAVSAYIFSNIGLKIVVSEKLIVPLQFGTAIRVTKYSGGGNDPLTDWGLSLGGGIEYHFRIWRRISPFVGGGLSFTFLDPTGSSNFDFSFSLIPTVGVEYYIGDRVSLAALYQFHIRLGWTDGASARTIFSATTLAGGAMVLTYYF